MYYTYFNFKSENIISPLNPIHHQGPDNNQSYTDKKKFMKLSNNILENHFKIAGISTFIMHIRY